MPRPIHGMWKKALSTIEVTVPRITRMTNAGVAKLNKALPHLRISGQ